MIHGVLLINKTAGGTSHDVVRAVRKILRQKAVGHAGALDPLAEGLMVILLGYGTKLSHYLLTADKQYHFTLRLGVTTDTLDKTGKITGTKEVRLSEERIKQVLQKSQGPLSLPVPLVSAVKIKGKKLYEYKRANQAIETPLREMTFYDLKIKNIQPETVEVVLSCSKGSYIRSWVSFVGKELETGACLETLTRLKSAPFKVESSLTLQEVEKRINPTGFEKDANSEDFPAISQAKKDKISLRKKINPTGFEKDANSEDFPAISQAKKDKISLRKKINPTGFEKDANSEDFPAISQAKKDKISLRKKINPTGFERDANSENTPPISQAKSLHEALSPAFIPFSCALPHLVAVRAGGRQDEIELRQGKIPSNLKASLMEEQKTVNKSQENRTVRVMNYNNTKMLALLELKPFVSPKFLRVFPPGLP